MSDAIYVVEIDYYSTTDGTLYFASDEGLNGTPGDTPANVFGKPLLIDPGNFESHMFAPGATIGRSEAGFGEIRLNNADGLLDAMRDYGYDRPLSIYRGKKPAVYPGGFTKIFTGTVKFVDYTETEIIVSISNRQGELYEQPLVTETFDGDDTDTTYGSGGYIEGTAEDLKGKYMPWVIGNGGGENWQLPMVNAGKQAFMVSLRRMNDDWTVYMSGAELTPGTKHASITALMAATVADGEFDYYVGDGVEGERAILRVGSALDGKITMKGTAYRASGAHTAGNCANDIFTAKATALDSASITALNTANSSVTGIYIDINGKRTGDALDAVLTGIGAAWFDTAAGVFKVKRLEDPAGGTSVKTFYSWMLNGDEKVRRLPANDTGNGTPCSEVDYDFNRNYTVSNESDLAGIVETDPARVQRLKNEWLNVKGEVSAGVLTKFPKALPFRIESLLTEAADGQNEADRQASLREVYHDHIEIAVDIDDAVADDGSALSLGDIVTLDYSRYSATGSDKYVVLGIIANYGDDNVLFRLWRPRTT